MRKSKFSESQIVGILKDAESGVPVADLLRKHGVSKATFFKWRSKYGGRLGVGREAAARARGGEREAETDVRGPGARERRHQGCPEPKAVRPDRGIRAEIFFAIVENSPVTNYDIVLLPLSPKGGPPRGTPSPYLDERRAGTEPRILTRRSLDRLCLERVGPEGRLRAAVSCAGRAVAGRGGRRRTHVVTDAA